MADRLEALLERFSVSARMFHSGVLCGINDIPVERQAGQLHLIRGGHVEVMHGGALAFKVTEPSVLLYPRPMAHRFVTDPERGAELTCANLHFDGGAGNPIVAALPVVVCLPLADLSGAQGVLDILFEEAFLDRCGRRALVDRLFEVVLIQILRRLMESGEVRGGMLAGLSHPRLRNALIAMHEAPAREWPLGALAAEAGMSRSVFASAFRDVVGSTPGAYLQDWRISLVQQALRRGRPLKTIAIDVGYGSEAALSRAFKARIGESPRVWRGALRSERSGEPAS